MITSIILQMKLLNMRKTKLKKIDISHTLYFVIFDTSLDDHTYYAVRNTLENIFIDKKKYIFNAQIIYSHLISPNI